MKLKRTLQVLGALVAAAVLAVLLVLRVTSDRPIPPPKLTPPPRPIAAARSGPKPATQAECFNVRGWQGAARANTLTLRSLEWSPFGRRERGWEVYVPLVQREIGTACAPTTAGFAEAYAQWQGDQRLLPTGRFDAEEFLRLKGVLQTRRAFVRLAARRLCPDPPPEARLASARPDEGYAGKAIQLRPGALAAYRRMVEAAKREDPAIGRDLRYLTIFSGFRSPAYDAARCAREGNCNGVVRATCSPHRTGLAMDLYMGQAPGFGPDSSADANRRFMVHTPAYKWLVTNAHRFGFVNYPFEPWHWEWTGEAP